MADQEVVIRRRVNPLLIVLLVVALLAAVLFFLILPIFSGTDTTEEPLPRTIPQPGVSPTPTAAPTAAAPPETFEVFESKDPFRPLVTEATDTGGVPTDGTGGTTTGGTTTGGTTGGGTTGDGTTEGGTSGAGGAPAPSGGQRVSLLDIIPEENKAQVKVGSTVHTVGVGEEFASNFKLVSISGTCATLLHGDDKFTLCEGEEVIK